jgi:formylglycine-generating enzyme required for sulfatase activity
VVVAAFSIDRHEVTNGQYELCVRAGKCAAPRQPSTEASYDEEPEDFPVVYVDAFQAAAFCRWLGRRLPSEAEWERVARGTHGRSWPWGDRPPTRAHANVRLRDYRPTGVVAVDDSRFSGDATPEGVVDLAGNVREWTATPERCQPSAYRCAHRWGGTQDVNALIRRGNGWTAGWAPITGADALASDPALREGDDSGFRCAKSE